MLDTTRINFADPRFKANPYPVYAQLRQEAPVCRVKLWGLEAWMITRYDDVVAAFKDDRLASDRRRAPTQGRPLREEAMFRLTGALNRTMLASDEPDHGRLRALVQKAFTQRRVEGMRQRVESLTEELLERVTSQKQMDVIHDLALALPTTIIAEMLGLPVSDRERFHRWTNAILTLSSMSWRNIAKVGPTMFALRRYMQKMVRLRRKQPGDDLISALVAAEEAGDKLSEGEMAAMIFLLLFAGHETTVNLIGNGVLALAENPEAMEMLRKQPALMPCAVEELLRYDGPLELANVRWARCDVQMNGATIGKGEPVMLCLTAANRDETQFANPDQLNIRREPNRHVAFGQGIHYCLGAFLARLEAQTAFGTLLRRFPDLRLAVPRQQLRWRNSFALRGLESLPVAFS